MLKDKKLCEMGLHDWGRERMITYASSNVYDYEKHCRRCGKTARRVVPKPY